MNPTRTTNRLHFEDLDPKRFEDLCVSLIYRMKKWHDIKHYGASGKDDGIDIYTVEINNEIKIKWMIQCKRYKSIKKNELKKIIDNIVITEIPDKILLIVSCDVSKTNQDYFKNYAKGMGINENFIWTQSILESKLYSECQDLLYIYFHIDVRETVKSNIKLINNRVKLRDLFKKEFYKQFDPSKPAIGFHRFNCGKIIIRKHDYINNNENISDEFGWYSYFGGEPYEITDVGILLVIGLFKGYIKDSNFYKYEENKSIPKDIKLEKFYKFALLPYDNILTFDLNSGDGNPVMYCKYSGENGPFKEVYYDSVDRYKL